MMARFASSASHPRDREAHRRQGTSPCVGPRAELARRTAAAGKVRHRARTCKHACEVKNGTQRSRSVVRWRRARLARCECEDYEFPFPHTTPIIMKHGCMEHARLMATWGTCGVASPGHTPSRHSAMRATAAAACYLLTFLLASRRWVMALPPVFPGSYSSA